MSKPKRKCIFGCDGKASKEHIWPDWMGDYLIKYPENQRVEFSYTRKPTATILSEVKEVSRPGQTWNKKIRAVCKKCNNEWMSDVENQTKDILQEIIIGKKHEISLAEQAQLARWVCLKIMVAEHNEPEWVIISKEDRDVFKKQFQIPFGLKIWIGKCGIDAWNSSYVRHTSLYTIAPPFKNNPPTSKRNTQSFAIGFGELFVFVIYSRDPRVTDFIAQYISFPLNRIYPAPDAHINFGSLQAMPAARATQFAHFFDHLNRQSSVQWMGD